MIVYFIILLLVIIGLGMSSSAFASEHIAHRNDPVIQVEIGDSIDDRGLRPIVITQVFSNTEHLDRIHIYDFELDNENQWEGRSQESLPYSHRIFEMYGKKQGESTVTKINPEPIREAEDSVVSLSYAMDCKYMNSTIHTNSGLTYAIPEGFSKIMVKQSNDGILPTDYEFAKNKQYLFHLASFYKQKIIAPKNSFHTMYSDEICDIEFEGFKTGHYSHLLFIFADDSNIFRGEGIQSNDGKTYPLLVGKESVITIDLKGTYDDNPNATTIRAGYAIAKYNGTDIIPHPPDPDASNKEEQIEYAMSIPKYIDSFHKTATFQDHQDFEINNSELSDRAIFSFVPPEVGHYSFSIYTESFPSEFPDTSSSQRSFIVVKESSKALREHGQCKSFELRPVAKPDYSSVVCVSATTSTELKQRGWH